MKQLLFATTALIATASMASAEINWTGFGRFGIGYQEDRGNQKFDGSDYPDTITPVQSQIVDGIDDRLAAYQRQGLRQLDPAIRAKINAAIPTDMTHAQQRKYVGPPSDTNISDTILISRFRLNVDGIAHTDGGAKFEARLRLEADENADDGSAKTATLNGGRFGVSYGGLQVFAGNTGGALDNMDNRGGNEPGMEGFIGQSSAINYSYVGYKGTAAGDNAVYFSYAVGDLRFAASYDQNSTATVSEVIAAGEYEGKISVDVPNVDRWDISATYTFGNVTAAIAHGQNDLDESLTLLTLGAEFGDFAGTLLVADDDVIGNSLNGTAYGLSGAYALSAATTINFAYGNGSAESDTQKFGFGVSHDLGGSVKLIGGIGQSKVGDGDGRLQADFGAYFDF